MQLSNGIESMLHCSALLATLPAGKALPAAKLAEYHDLPAAYLAKHLQMLAAAHLVQGGRGRVGGYRLARPPEQITVLDVVEAIEGTGPLFRCTGIRFAGPCATDAACAPATCPVTEAMQAAERAWRAALAQQTIADLVQAAQFQADTESVARSVAWLERAMR